MTKSLFRNHTPVSIAKAHDNMAILSLLKSNESEGYIFTSEDEKKKKRIIHGW